MCVLQYDNNTRIVHIIVPTHNIALRTENLSSGVQFFVQPPHPQPEKWCCETVKR